MDLARVCYNHPDFEICQAANKVCWDGVIKHYDGESGANGGRDRFDISHPCETNDDLCYKEIALIQEYLNLPWVFEALGVPKAVGNYSIYSMDIEGAFDLTSDASTSTQPQVLYLLEAGIDVLFYQGNMDLACNTAGNLQWANSMAWKGQPAFVAQPKRPWKHGKKETGWFKEVKTETRSGRQTTFAMSTVDGAGHLVPYNKPKEALALVDRWLTKKSFA
jgi:cathepsin A (carboxypeptidase C)